MKKVILSLSFLLSIVLISFSQNTNDKSKLEPKTNFELFINGHKYIVSEGEELKLDTTFTKPVISIKEAEYKKFENQSFSFQYPKNYIYSFEQDFGYKNWTLTYNNLVVMIFEIDAKTTLNEILEETIKKLGKKNCKVSDIEKEIGHKKCVGKKLAVTLVGQKITYDYFEIMLNDFKSRFICFQDSLKEDNSASDDYITGFKIIDSTMIYK